MSPKPEKLRRFKSFPKERKLHKKEGKVEEGTDCDYVKGPPRLEARETARARALSKWGVGRGDNIRGGELRRKRLRSFVRSNDGFDAASTITAASTEGTLQGVTLSNLHHYCGLRILSQTDGPFKKGMSNVFRGEREPGSSRGALAARSTNCENVV